MTAVVVAFNDARYLGECLRRLSFCVDAVVVDLGSADDSVAVAEAMGARVVEHGWVPYGELAREFAFSQAKTDWVISLDPDIMFPEGAEHLLEELILQHSRAGLLAVPYQNYFGGKPLRYGRWGGLRADFPVLVNRNRVDVVTSVHGGGLKMRAGFDALTTRGLGDYVLKHYWVESWQELEQKLQRYLASTAESRYQAGQRSRGLSWVPRATFVLVHSLVYRLGFLDGWDGVRLSVVAAAYERRIDAALLSLQRQQTDSWNA